MIVKQKILSRVQIGVCLLRLDEANLEATEADLEKVEQLGPMVL